MIRGLDDYKKDDKKDAKKTNDYYVGGASSGMNVQNPDDWVEKVKKNPNDKEAFDSTKNKLKLTVYKNGFQIDDGEFRNINVPENKKFMDEVEKGYIPQEIVDQGKKELAIALEDKRKEDYKEPIPEKKFQAFVGGGTSLGNIKSEGLGINKDFKFQIDKQSPTTTINFRLHTGDTVTQEFNLYHTVGDIFQFVASVAPVSGSFQLVEGFPPKPLLIFDKSIQELRLQGSTMIQRLC